MEERASPFRVSVPDADLDDLHRRLDAVRWPSDPGNEDGRFGLREVWMKEAVAFWRNEFDWREVEAEMNLFPQFMAEIDGMPIHFIHVRSTRADATPLVLTHGWPWSFWDWKEMILPLTAPEDSADPAFHVVVPSLPGYTFSTPLTEPGIDVRRVGQMWRRLMCDVLGYPRFIAAGADWGSMVSAELGHAHGDVVIGVGVAQALVPGMSPEILKDAKFAPDEQVLEERTRKGADLTISHMTVHQHGPQTLAYAQGDSPVGLAAWLWERRLNFSDDRLDGGVRSLQSLCTIASLYWFTNCAASTMRLYAEQYSHEWPSLTGRERAIDVPTAIIAGIRDVAFLPKAVSEKVVDLQHWAIMNHGGHFAPAEVPDLLLAEYRKAFAAFV